FVVMARLSRSAYLESVFCETSRSRRNSAFNERRMLPPPPPELRRRIFTAHLVLPAGFKSTGYDNPAAFRVRRTADERFMSEKPKHSRDVVFNVSSMIEQIRI